MSGEEQPCIIMLCKCGCGRVVYANANDADKLTQKDHADIGKAAADGYTVLRTTVGDARSRQWFCESRRRERAK